MSSVSYLRSARLQTHAHCEYNRSVGTIYLSIYLLGFHNLFNQMKRRWLVSGTIASLTNNSGVGLRYKQVYQVSVQNTENLASGLCPKSNKCWMRFNFGLFRNKFGFAFCQIYVWNKRWRAGFRESGSWQPTVNRPLGHLPENLFEMLKLDGRKFIKRTENSCILTFKWTP